MHTHANPIPRLPSTHALSAPLVTCTGAKVVVAAAIIVVLVTETVLVLKPPPPPAPVGVGVAIAVSIVPECSTLRTLLRYDDISEFGDVDGDVDVDDEIGPPGLLPAIGTAADVVMNGNGWLVVVLPMVVQV